MRSMKLKPQHIDIFYSSQSFNALPIMPVEDPFGTVSELPQNANLQKASRHAVLQYDYRGILYFGFIMLLLVFHKSIFPKPPSATAGCTACQFPSLLRCTVIFNVFVEAVMPVLPADRKSMSLGSNSSTVSKCLFKDRRRLA